MFRSMFSPMRSIRSGSVAPYTTASSGSAAKAGSILTAFAKSIGVGIRLLPSSITSPFCKLVNATNGLTYQLRVYGNVAKLVLKNQGYRLPTSADFHLARTEFDQLLHGLTWRNLASKSNFDMAKIKNAGLVAGELATLFVIGEQVGRGKIIGYYD
ncbi:hypothetical protein AYI68_g5949 [Smittium mucronatum]|uniref:ATP synthase subunit g, mitochondrial n=1 Tax=Smittium mucronatum TaxID=133383 RepID=A0A1R0GSU5_9FUNG|nr:hypothetical protein AYI68_g5949 [Smittium mucronatum]